MELKEIYLKKEDFRGLDLFAERIHHIESTLYQYNGKLLKIFNNYDFVNDKMLRKQSKINYFLDNLSINFLTNPLFAVYIDNVFAGYGMEKIDSQYNFYDYCLKLNRSDSIQYLKMLSNILKSLHQNYDIAIIDLNYHNILVSNDQIILCDIDSYRINNIEADNYLYITTNNKYLDNNAKTTYLSDVFILYIIILNILYDYNYKNVAYCPSLESYQRSIQELEMPKSVEQIYLELYKMINSGYQIIYPDQFLDELDITSKSNILKRKKDENN